MTISHLSSVLQLHAFSDVTSVCCQTKHPLWRLKLTAYMLENYCFGLAHWEVPKETKHRVLWGQVGVKQTQVRGFSQGQEVLVLHSEVQPPLLSNICIVPVCL